ncbi:ent-kaurenoic acid oxidase 1-like [Vicia villosa]|uniref:ent-kaurenoic acid oxidase 1-like n=1 Tax=Vicia villosa TaxID=3911 RepID=UPI00273C5291|nr:ent-kaurenoic acid oxidase 1-like [Vicia villosa]
MSFENIGKLFLGKEPVLFLNSLDKLYQGVLPGVRAYPINILGFAYHHALRCRRKLEDIFSMELNKRKLKNGNKVDALDLMDGLMQIEDDEGNKLSDKEVVDNIVSFVLGGYISISLVSMWAIYFLAKHPNVLKLLWDSYQIPKRWKVISMLCYIHTDPENFRDPMSWQNLEHIKFFCAGQRLCPGNMLARIQLALLLHHLSIGYKWELINHNANIMYLSNPAPIDRVEVKLIQL